MVTVALAGIVFHGWAILPHYNLGFQKTLSIKKELSEYNVFYANLFSQNSSKDKLISILKDTHPDFVLLIEVNSSWIKELSKIKDFYPYSKIIAQEGNFGMAILSTTPLEVQKTFVDRKHLIPAMFLKTSFLNIALLHPHPPIGKYGTLLRNQYLEALSAQLTDMTSPTLVCGDFNTTPWSISFKRFLKKSKLRLNSVSSNIRTWPTHFLVPGIPIDHCLAKNLNFITYRKGPNIGSDHWPIVTRIAIPSKTVTKKK